MIKSCKECKFYPPEKKWPCEDCDMRFHDRAEYNEPDVNLLIRCAIEAGATVKKVKAGEGGLYIKGTRIAEDEFECLFEPKPPTNYDVIMQMSIEELAEYFSYICDTHYKPSIEWLKWLKEEYEE